MKLALALVALAHGAAASNGEMPGMKLTLGDAAVNKGLQRAMPFIEGSINSMLQNMSAFEFKVLTQTMTVGPFDENCAVTNMNQSSTVFSAKSGLDFTARFYLDCEAPYKIVDIFGITVAHGTMTLKDNNDAYIEDVSTVGVDGAGHLVLGGNKASTNFKPLIWFSGLVGDLLSVVLKIFQPLIKLAVDRAIESGLEDAIAKLNTDVLAKLPLQIPIKTFATFDTAVAYATTGDGYLSLGLDATFQPFNESLADKSNPFEVRELIDLNSTEASDAQFQLSDYTILTALWSLSTSGVLNMTLPGDKLTTTELALVAPRMAKEFPKTNVRTSLVVSDIDDTAFHTEAGFAGLKLPVNIAFSPVVEDATVPGFTVSAVVQAELFATVAVKEYKNVTGPRLVGNLTVLDVSDVAVVDSAVGVVNVKMIQNVIHIALAGAEAGLNEFLAVGEAIPSLLTDTSVHLGVPMGESRVATNLNFDGDALPPISSN